MTEPVPVDHALVARENAERIMYELLGHRWVWPALTVVEVVDLYPGQHTVSLQGRPITNVDYVRKVGSEYHLGHVLESSSRIRLQEAHSTAGLSTYRQSACGGVTSIEVKYTYGSPPPPTVVMAIDELAAEILKALNGSDECRLPERVTSVTREGLSMALLDPQDFLDKGRTGLTRVDMVLSAHNPTGSRRRAKVVGRATPLGVRVTPPPTA